MSNPTPEEWKAMTELVSQFYDKVDADPFREPVPWKTLGLKDYPKIIENPMDLGFVKKKLDEEKYDSIHEAVEDVRLIWKNCKLYNADGSDIYHLAQSLEEEFEEKFEKIFSTKEGSTLGGECRHSRKSVANPTITDEGKRAFAEGLFKLSKKQLKKVFAVLESQCPTALVFNSNHEVEINVDNITAVTFTELAGYVNSRGSRGDGFSKK